MNLKKLILQLLLMTMMVVVSCTKNDKKIALNISSTKKTNNSTVCENLKTKGLTSILCEVSNENILSISKTEDPTQVYFYVEIFTSTNLKTPLLVYQDKIDDCPVDFFIDYLDSSYTVNDIDNNDQQEFTVVYEKNCTGGIGPNEMVLLLIQKNEIHKIKGRRILKIDMKEDKELLKNYQYQISESFQKVPKILLEHALKNWEEFLIQE